MFTGKIFHGHHDLPDFCGLYMMLPNLLHSFELTNVSNGPVDMIEAFDMATPLGEAVDLTESPGLTIPKATPLEVVLTPRLPNKLYI
nr:cytochrome P450 82C4-like [Ipomoea trifida]